jgi:hypothetical protein
MSIAQVGMERLFQELTALGWCDAGSVCHEVEINAAPYTLQGAVALL